MLWFLLALVCSGVVLVWPDVVLVRFCYDSGVPRLRAAAWFSCAGAPSTFGPAWVLRCFLLVLLCSGLV